MGRPICKRRANHISERRSEQPACPSCAAFPKLEASTTPPSTPLYLSSRSIFLPTTTPSIMYATAPGAASGFALPLKQNPHHQTPRETTNDHRSCSKAKDLPQADGQKRRPGCSRTPWHRGCPVKAAQRRRWHDTRKDDDTKTTAVRDGPHEYRPHSLQYHLSSPTSD